MKFHKNLSDIRNNLFDQAEQWWNYSIILSFITLLLSILAIIINEKGFLFFCSGFSFFGQILAFFFKKLSSEAQEKGDRCRRIILYSDGLGNDIKKENYAIAKQWAGLKEVAEAPYVKPYFASKLSPGPQRLADIVAESAYFTNCLAYSTTNLLKWILGLIAILAFGMVYVAFFAQLNQTTLVTMGKTILVLVGFFFLGDIINIYYKYQKMSKVAIDVFIKLSEMAKNSSLKDHEVMQVVEDYNIVINQTPPLPRFIYTRDKEKINTAYRNALLEDEKNE